MAKRFDTSRLPRFNASSRTGLSTPLSGVATPGTVKPKAMDGGYGFFRETEVARQLNRGGGGPQSGLDQLVQTGFDTLERTEQAERQRYEQADRGLNLAEDTFGRLPQDARELSDRAIAEQYREGGPGALTRQYADDAIRQSELAADRFGESTIESIQAQVNSVQSSLEEESRRIQSGLNPDGTLMTDAQKSAATTRLNQTVRESSARVFAETRQNADQFLAQLRNQTAGLQMNAAGLFREQSQFEASLRTANEMRALEARAMGFGELAQMRQQHYFSPANTYSLMQELVAASATGAGNISALGERGNVGNSPLTLGMGSPRSAGLTRRPGQRV